MIEGKTVQFEDAYEQQGFVQLPRYVLHNTDLSHGAKLLYAAFRGYAREAESCYPGQKRLGEELGVSTRTVQTWIAELEKADLVVVSRRGMHQTNRYILTPQKTASLDTKPASHQDTKPASHKVEAVGIEAEQTNKGGVGKVWDHYVELFNPRSKKMDPGQRKIIKDALEYALPETLNACLDAAATSDYHQKRGAHATRNGRKYTSLTDILKPKRAGKYAGYTQSERIDFWLGRTDGTASGPSQEERDAYNLAVARHQNEDGPDPGVAPWNQ